MEIRRSGTLPTKLGPPEYFTGTVWQDPIADTPSPALLKSNLVTFAPGARTAWHRHPLGQTLYVTAGSGRIQTLGGPILTLSPGDSVWIPPEEKHWHGAGPDTMMSHISMQEAVAGVAVEWLEHVTDEEYAGLAQAAPAAG